MHKTPRCGLLTVAIAFLGACAPSDKSPQPGTTEGSAVDGGATVVSATSLGSISFQRDGSIEPAVATIARDQEAKLEVTDAQGSRWALTIPAGSVRSGTRVSLIPLAHLSSTDLPAPPVGGVLLEPDGLVLLRPATLSVTHPGEKKPTLLLTGRHDGTDMAFTLPAENTAGAAALLSHFSTVAEVSPATPEQKAAMRAAGLKQRAALLNTVRTLLKQDIGAMPTPPSLELECNDEIVDLLNRELIDHFVRQAGDPELDLWSQWIGVNRSLFENEADSADSEWIDIARQLNLRLLKKAKQLLRTYRGQRDKALAVASFYIAIARMNHLCGDEPGLDQIGDWLADLLEPMFKDLIEKHDYRQVAPILEIGKRVQLLGGTTKEGLDPEVVDRLFSALEFRLETEFKLHLPKQEWLVKATVPISVQLGSQSTILAGEGTGRAVSYSGASSVPMKAQYFSVTAVVDDFDACAGTATIRISQQAGKSETYDIGEGRLQAALPLIENSWKAMFGEQASENGGYYSFPCKVRNFDAKAIEETIHGTTPHGKVSGDLTLRLIHVPKKSGAPRAYSP